jgi:hypothetical protein
MLDEAQTELRRMVAAKLVAAERRLSELTTHLDDASKAVVLASLSGRPMSSTDHEEPQECPVCRQQDWLLCGVIPGDPELDMQPDGTVYRWITKTAYPFGFECPVCDLDLEDEELTDFDFPDEIELEAEPDDD